MIQNGRRSQLVLAMALGAFVILGLPDGALGTVWPTLRDDFGRPQSGFGHLIVGLAVGYTSASLASGHITRRLGVGRTLQIASITSCAGLLLVGTGTGWWTVVAGFAVLGAGNGTIDAGLNAWVALTRGPRAMGLLHAAYGIGATLGPLLATAFVAGGDYWRGPFLAVLGLELVAVVGITRLRTTFDAAPTRAEIPDRGPAGGGGSRLVTLMIVWFGLYVAAEVTIGQWSFTLLTEDRGVSDRVGGVLVASYWGGLTVGRLALGVFGNRVHPERLLAVVTVASIVFTGFFWLDPGGTGQWALPFVGLAFAVMFPIVVNRTPVYLGAERAGHIVGYQLAASAIGGTTVPYAVGALADEKGVGVTGPVAFATVVAMAVAAVAMQREAATARNATRTTDHPNLGRPR